VAVEQGKAVKLIDAAELVPGMNLAVLMYGQRLLERERELGERFMRAFHRANTTKRELAATPQGRDEIAAVYQKYVPRQDGSIYARVPQPLGREDLLVNVHGPNGLADQLAWYVKQGLVPEVPDLDRSVVDNSFAEKAKKAGM
jgi:ABC-type nitrate/sulfonate/bicarbonate transport system substrate-binding protein